MELCKRYPTPAPKPGVYHGVPAEEYHAWAAVAASTLTSGETAREIKHFLDTESKDETGALWFGTLTHSVLLEDFDHRAANVVEVDKVKKPSTGRMNQLTEASGAELWAAAKADHPDSVVVAPGWLERLDAIKAMRDNNARACELFDRIKPDNREVSIVWECERTGLLRKGRIDAYLDPEPGSNTPFGGIVDVKTSRHSNPVRFSGDVFEHGYHIGAANYYEGSFALGLIPKGAPFEWLMISKAGAGDVTVCPASEETMTIGVREMEERLWMIARGVAEGDWPGHDDEYPIFPPRWKSTEFADGG